VATFTYDPTDRRAWVADLVAADRPGSLHLCADHAARFSVPVGWTLVDERAEPPAGGAAVPSSPLLARAFRASLAS